MHDTIVQQAYDVFRTDVATPPAITLRGGNDLDAYQSPTPYDPIADVLTDAYIEKYAPDRFLSTLRPTDSEPPRLRSLTPAQEAVIVAFLEALAFDDDTHRHEHDALLILEEWWLPNSRYRPS